MNAVKKTHWNTSSNEANYGWLNALYDQFPALISDQAGSEEEDRRLQGSSNSNESAVLIGQE